MEDAMRDAMIIYIVYLLCLQEGWVCINVDV